MKQFDIFRHADDDLEGNITLIGWKQIDQLITFLQKRGDHYDLCVSSPYDRCKTTLSAIAKSLATLPSKTHKLQLCTPNPNDWVKKLDRKSISKMIPQHGNIYAICLEVAPELILLDGQHFIQEIEDFATTIPDSSRVIGISHHTIMLAASSLVLEKDVFHPIIPELPACNGISFIIYNNRITHCQLSLLRETII